MNLAFLSLPAALCLVTTAAFGAGVTPSPRVTPRIAPVRVMERERTASTRLPIPRSAKPAAAKPRVAKPDPSALRGDARAWADEWNLPIREIEVGPPDRRVTRLFVPITAENWASFVARFGSGPRLLLKLKSGDKHMMPVVDGDTFLAARSVHRAGLDPIHGLDRMKNDGPDGPAIVLSLDEKQARHVRQWFEHRADPNDALWSPVCDSECMDYVGNIEVGASRGGVNTLRTIPRQEIEAAAGNERGLKGGMSTKIPMGKSLFDVLGVARSKDGRNMAYNMIHAGNERVQVVGIPVGSDIGGYKSHVVREKGTNGDVRVFVRKEPLTGTALERFTQMTDAELLGPAPPQGVEGVVRRTK